LERHPPAVAADVTVGGWRLTEDSPRTAYGHTAGTKGIERKARPGAKKKTLQRKTRNGVVP